MKAFVLFRSRPSPDSFSPALLAAQEPAESQKITVRSTEVNNGVVKEFLSVAVQQGLCGLHDPGTGDYLMTRLPKNRVVHDCANVEVYRNPAEAEAGNKLGQYCLTDTK